MRAVVLFLLLASAAFAAAPETLERDHLFVEAGRTIARSSFQAGVLLLHDGSFRGFFSAGSQPNLQVFYNGPVSDGRWTYRKTAADRAEFTLIRADPARPETHLLEFTTPSSGTIIDASLAILSRTFELRPSTASHPLTNSSLRSFVAAGRSASAGFVIGGERRRVVLLRAAGASLAPFGVRDGLVDPALHLTRNGVLLASNDDWDGTRPVASADSIRRTEALVGAFPLGSGSRDAALVIELPPGAYVAEVTSASGHSGECLIEIYLLP